MATLTRRISSALLAAAMVAGLAAEPAFAQITPGASTVGPAGGVGSTTAPSNSEGTPSGGTGNIGSTRVGPSGMSAAPRSYTATPQTARPARRRVARRKPVRRAPRAAMSDTGAASSAGLNGANAPSR